MIYIQVPSCGDGYVYLSVIFAFLSFHLHGVVVNISGVIYTVKSIFTSLKGLNNILRKYFFDGNSFVTIPVKKFVIGNQVCKIAWIGYQNPASFFLR